MDLAELVDAVLAGDLLRARQWVADAKRKNVDWESFPLPAEMDERSLAITAALLELFADRGGGNAPSWTQGIGALDDTLVLDPGLDAMRRSFAYAKEHGPSFLLKRNLVALPDFLDVA